jgi:uncharacterized membrane protein
MSKGRLEAFSDGVIAIIITIMVLDLKLPREVGTAAFRELLPVLATYLLSYVFVGIYWVNHHHLLHAAHKVSGSVLWANLHLLFWLSLIPFATRWAAEDLSRPGPVAFYGFVLLLAGTAYYVLTRRLLATHEKGSALSKAVGHDYKGIASVLVYIASIPLAFFHTGIAFALFVLVALIWLVPDRRIERALQP